MSDLQVELIYYQTKTDFEMEFNLGGVCHMRLITAKADTPGELVSALKSAVSRNRVIMLVGRTSGEWGLFDIVAKATSHPLCTPDYEKYNCTRDFTDIPESALPLVTSNGALTGCILENTSQSIVVLTDKKALRHKALNELVHPYITDINNYVPPVTSQEVAITEDISQNEPVDLSGDGEINFSPNIEEPIEETPAEELSSQKNAVELNDLATTISSALQTTEQEEIEKQLEAMADDNNRLQNDIPANSPLSVNENDFFFDKKPKKKHKKALKAVIIALICVVLLALGVLAYFKIYMPLRAKSVYRSAAQNIGKYSDTLPDNALNKFGKVYKTNKALCGWVSIGSTDISYPVVYSKSNYYDSHLYNKEYNLCGCPATSEKITSSTHLRNTVITSNGNFVGNILGKIQNYSSLDFYKSAPIIRFDSLYEESTYKIISVFSYKGKAPFDYTKPSFSDNTEFSHYIEKLLQSSDIVTTVDVTEDDTVLTLVNTDKNGVTSVAVGRKTRQDESVAVDVSTATLNKNHTKRSLSTSSLVESEESSSSPAVEIVSSAPVAPTAGTVSVSKPNPKKKLANPKETQETPISQQEVNNNLDEVAKKMEEQKKPTTSSITPSTPADPNNGWLPLTATNSYTGAQVSGTAIEVISQICAAEMGAGYEVEALKAQAIAAYCWMLCNGGATNKFPTVPMKEPNEKIINAVKSVAGKVAYYGKDKSGKDKIAQLYYYAYSAGVTANCSDIWSSDFPYLRMVDSSVDKSHKDFETLRTYKASDIAVWVKESTGIDLTKTTDKNSWFHLTYANNGASPYVKTLTFGSNSTKYKGTYLRSTIFTAARTKAANYGDKYVLKSGAYTITYNSKDDTFTFTVKGYGHGVGMSQYGANQYALSGYNYLQILQHYYPGITVK